MRPLRGPMAFVGQVIAFFRYPQGDFTRRRDLQ
jgi:hypothetical protein